MIGKAADLHNVRKRRNPSPDTDAEESEGAPIGPSINETCNKDTENIDSESVQYYFAVVDAKSFGKFLIPTYNYNKVNIDDASTNPYVSNQTGSQTGDETGDA